jgi:hypothetical protein
MMDVQVTQIISTCMSLGLFVSINQRLDAETISIVAEEFGYRVEFASAEDIEKSYEKRRAITVEKFTFLGNNYSTGSNIIFYGIPAVLFIIMICIFIFLKDRKR